MGEGERLFAPGEPVAGTRLLKPVGPVGQAILRHLRTEPFVSPQQAGRICHDLRGKPCGAGAKDARFSERSGACCAYCSDDGLAALKRLVAAGYLERTGHGRYARVKP